MPRSASTPPTPSGAGMRLLHVLVTLAVTPLCACTFPDVTYAGNEGDGGADTTTSSSSSGGTGGSEAGPEVACGATTCTAGMSCLKGACACSTGLMSCPSGCADLSADLANCGSCGHVCNAGQACKGGHCH